jgi:hypothetical protein
LGAADVALYAMKAKIHGRDKFGLGQSLPVGGDLKN